MTLGKRSRDGTSKVEEVQKIINLREIIIIFQEERSVNQRGIFASSSSVLWEKMNNFRRNCRS